MLVSVSLVHRPNYQSVGVGTQVIGSRPEIVFELFNFIFIHVVMGSAGL